MKKELRALMSAGVLLTCLLCAACVSSGQTPANSAFQAMRLVRTGQVYSLAHVTNSTTPAVQGRNYSVEVSKIPGGAIGTNKLSGLDDRLVAHIGIGSQIDSLAHIGIDGVHYGGVHIDSIYRGDGVTKYGVENIAPIVTRGLLLDMAALLETDLLPPDTAYDANLINAALKRQKLRIKAGDVVLFHSGWGQLLGQDNERWLRAHPGLDVNGAALLAEYGVIAVGADTPALEISPAVEEGELYPVHQVLLVKHGIYILEALRTAELAADHAYEFAFVLGVPRLGGAVQAPVNPIAIR